jgi:hypothetical protein
LLPRRVEERPPAPACAIRSTDAADERSRIVARSGRRQDIHVRHRSVQDIPAAGEEGGVVLGGAFAGLPARILGGVTRFAIARKDGPEPLRTPVCLDSRA